MDFHMESFTSFPNVVNQTSYRNLAVLGNSFKAVGLKLADLKYLLQRGHTNPVLILLKSLALTS